jgi:nicotinate-nucleotide adenylyltransferase
MVRLAIEDHRRFKASNIEFKLPQPSYTINTLAHLKEKYPKREFSLLIGMDNLQTFDKWKNYEQILKNHKLYVYPRLKSDGKKFKDHPSVIITEAPVIEISSSFIRKAIAEKKDVSCFMPEKVAKYIQEMNFYKSKS